MRTIKVKVVDWWNGDFKDNYFIKILSKKYQVIQSNQPDYLICSVFGNKHLKYDCIKIFFTGEAITPNFNFYDYALGFDHLDFGDRYFRYPLFLTGRYRDCFKLAEKKHLLEDEDKLLQRGFCSFVVSNSTWADSLRGDFFDALLQIDFVASGGRYKNNIGRRIKNKLAFLQAYKFNMCFENSSYRGYCTEKLIEAFAAQSIPIYWGDPNLNAMGGGDIEPLINKKALINIQDFKNTHDAIEYIQEIHHNPKLYLELLKQRAFLQENILENYEEKLEKFLENIIEQPYEQAKRAVVTQWQKIYFNQHQKAFFPQSNHQSPSPYHLLCSKIKHYFSLK